jgi:hypothetical protein
VIVIRTWLRSNRLTRLSLASFAVGYGGEKRSMAAAWVEIID